MIHSQPASPGKPVNSQGATEGQIVKRGGGRPSKITPELIALAWDYLKTTSTVSRGQLLPTIEGLALAIGVDRSTLQDWEKQEGNEFSLIIRELRSAQAEKLIQNALTGNYNPTIAKLLLSKHGYIEKREDDITSGGQALGVAMTPEQAAQLIRARAERAE